jgi:hypothetical protein
MLDRKDVRAIQSNTKAIKIPLGILVIDTDEGGDGGSR